MTAPAIRLTRTIANRILEYAQASPQAEICGLLGGCGDEATGCYPVRNIATSPDCRYQMDPKEQIDALRHIRERGEELLAIYHSHPHGPAWPSATDLKEASYPEAVYLIISLETGGVLEMRGFRLRDGRAEEVQLELV